MPIEATPCSGEGGERRWIRKMSENETRDVSALCVGKVFNRRFAMYAGEQKAEEEFHGAFFKILTACRDIRRPECGSERDGMRMQQRLQMQMREQERGVEGGIAEPGAFGIEHDEALRSHEQILRTVVAMHERELRFSESCGLDAEDVANSRHAFGGSEQIGLDAKGVKVGQRVEALTCSVIEP